MAPTKDGFDLDDESKSMCYLSLFKMTYITIISDAQLDLSPACVQ